jgi:plastocyanin
MKKLALAGAMLALGLTVAVATAFGASSSKKLSGTDGPGYTISLKSGGKNATKLTKGTYSLTVDDKSSMHNFVVEGPGVAKDVTTIGGKGTKTVTLKLRPGKYKFYCRAHESSMFGYVTVK